MKLLSWLKKESQEQEDQDSQQGLVINEDLTWIDGMIQDRSDKNKEQVEKLEKELLENIKAIQAFPKFKGEFNHLKSPLRSYKKQKITDLYKWVVQEIKNPKRIAEVTTINNYKKSFTLNSDLLQVIDALKKESIYREMFGIKIILEQLVGKFLIDKYELNSILRKHPLYPDNFYSDGISISIYYGVYNISLNWGPSDFSNLEPCQQNLRRLETILKEVLEYIEYEGDKLS